MRQNTFLRSWIALGLAAAAGMAWGVELPLADDVARAKAEAIRAKMTLDQKVSLLGGWGTMYLEEYPALGIPRRWAMSDCSHAIKPEHGRWDWPYVQGVDMRCTTMPPLSAVAMTWNPEMAALHGRTMAEQMRALGKDQILGPGVNINRSPLCGRNWEYMSEDPFLTSKMVVPYIRAAQAQGVATTVKHFCVNNQELARTSVDTVVDERTLHEIYFPAFKAAIQEGGSIALMSSYNKFNGQHTSENAYLQRGILRDRWGFKGLIVTDWGGQHSCVPAALNGGNVEMNNGKGITHFTDWFNGKFPLADKVRAGEVPEATVDEMVTRVLFAMAKTGFLDGIQPKGERLTQKHRDACVTIGEEAVTLVKNEKGVLPLDRKTLKKVIVVGMQADQVFTPYGSSCESHASREITAFAGLRDALKGQAEVELLPLGAEFSPDGSAFPIPQTAIETFASDGNDAFVTRAWERLRWKEGKLWSDETVPDGFVSDPHSTLGCCRFRAKVRPQQDGLHVFVVTPRENFGSATVHVDGKAVTRTAGHKAKPVFLKKDRTYTVTVDVEPANDLKARFTFGWKTVSELDAAKRAERLREADAVIAFTGTVIGWGRARESEGADLPDMSEPEGHNEDIAAFLKMGLKNLVIVNRSATQLEMPWADDCDTLVQLPYLGQEGGIAFARVLLGDVNPSGKLAATFPRKYADTGVAQMGTYNGKQVIYNERFYVGYRWFDRKSIAPLFPFGHGLSYTTFAYSDVKSEACAACGGWKVSVKVANTGKVAGKETAQLYVIPEDPKVERCVKELKGFAKTKLLAPGADETLAFAVTPRELAIYDDFLHRWRAPAGTYVLAVGASSADLRGRVTVTLAKDVVFAD